MRKQLTKEVLNLDQPTEELNKIYRDNYYHYLDCVEFRKKFLIPLGYAINSLRPTSCLDVCCGNGYLSRYVKPTIPYYGFDGSEVAIDQARKKFPSSHERLRAFTVSRLEEPRLPGNWPATFDTVVFGNVFFVGVKDMMGVVEYYVRTYCPRFIIVYDLEALDLTPLNKYLTFLYSQHDSANVPEIEDIKRHRKFAIYSTRDILQ